MNEKIDLKNTKKIMTQLDRSASLLESMDSNKWKGIKKQLWDLAGISTKKDFDTAVTRMGLETSWFVKEISGAAVTDQEYARLANLLPSLWDTPKLALNKLAEFRLTRYENLTEPAIALLWNEREVFEQLYPELKWGWVYKTKQETNFMTNIIGWDSIDTSDVDDLIN